MANHYWSRLNEHSSTVKTQLDLALVEFGVFPVGHGYIDIIVPRTIADTFLASMSLLGVAIHRVSLWCEASERNKQRYGCPHGMGGPVHNGIWFSEMCEHDSFKVEDHGISIDQSQLDPITLAAQCNSLASDYVFSGMEARQDYSPCFAPGFWLSVPRDWRSDRTSRAA